MRRYLTLGRYNLFWLMVLLCVFAIVLAWNSFGLINIAMANVDFLRRHGLLAATEGGALQLLLIGVKAFVALLAYLGFKGVEVELIQRWRAWDARA